MRYGLALVIALGLASPAFADPFETLYDFDWRVTGESVFDQAPGTRSDFRAMGPLALSAFPESNGLFMTFDQGRAQFTVDSSTRVALTDAFFFATGLNPALPYPNVTHGPDPRLLATYIPEGPTFGPDSFSLSMGVSKDCTRDPGDCSAFPGLLSWSARLDGTATRQVQALEPVSAALAAAGLLAAAYTRRRR
ncbi:MAG: hypothetical protein ACREJG_01615 [Candidatus Rokuibacteriota bacterium]